MTAASWAPDQRGLFHALDDSYGLRNLHSLCGLRVDVDERLVIRQQTAADLLHISTVGTICRSCREKLEGRR